MSLSMDDDFPDPGQIAARLSRPRRPVPETSSTLSPAAVLLPFHWPDGRPHLILIERSRIVSTHKGQMAFPGGRREPGDASLLITALRETREELGCSLQGFSILGALPPQPTTSTGFLVHPFVAAMADLPRFAPDPREVASWVSIPWAFFRHNPSFSPQPAFTYRKYWIWGATAAIIQRVIVLLHAP
ncbi:MAG: CoA pyrophosphatase [Magnetococcales bacterium]|nr:CoA pyrophosphatase [Magnetococcales bacterium]